MTPTRSPIPCRARPPRSPPPSLKSDEGDTMRRRLLTIGLLLLWTLLVLYPNPLLLGRAIVQSWAPAVDVAAVRQVAASLPDDPGQIEAAVHDRLVRYEDRAAPARGPIRVPSAGRVAPAGELGSGARLFPRPRAPLAPPAAAGRLCRHPGPAAAARPPAPPPPLRTGWTGGPLIS